MYNYHGNAFRDMYVFYLTETYRKFWRQKSNLKILLIPVSVIFSEI